MHVVQWANISSHEAPDSARPHIPSKQCVIMIRDHQHFFTPERHGVAVMQQTIAFSLMYLLVQHNDC